MFVFNGCLRQWFIETDMAHADLNMDKAESVQFGDECKMNKPQYLG